MSLSPLSLSVATGAAILGVTVGWLGVASWIGPPTQPIVPPQRIVPVGAASATDDPACAPRRDQVDALATKAAAATREFAVRRGQLALIGGVPSPWPADFDAIAHEAALNEELAMRVADLMPDPKHKVDARAHCDEDPCLLAITVQAPGLESIDLLNALEADLSSTIGASKTDFVSGPSKPGWTRISWRIDDADQAAGVRASVRAKRLVDAP